MALRSTPGAYQKKSLFSKLKQNQKETTNIIGVSARLLTSVQLQVTLTDVFINSLPEDVFMLMSLTPGSTVSW